MSVIARFLARGPFYLNVVGNEAEPQSAIQGPLEPL